MIIFNTEFLSSRIVFCKAVYEIGGEVSGMNEMKLRVITQTKYVVNINWLKCRFIA